MLIFGASSGNWRKFAAYAQDKADNEFAKVREVKCEGIEDVDTALAAMAAYASDTNCSQFLYHATINLYRGERLTPAQWKRSVDELEKNLRLAGHYRVVFEHIKNDRQHYHILWSRVPPGGNGPAVNMGNNYRIHEGTAIALEKEFGLRSAPRKNKATLSRKRQENVSRNDKVRVDRSIVTKDVGRAVQESQSAKAFVKHLASNGYTLTRGRANKLVIVDRKGGYHGLLRRADGFKAADIRQKFPELEKMKLPALGDVLKARRPRPKVHFRIASIGITRPRRYTSSFKPSFAYQPIKSIATLIAEAKKYHPKEDKKYYPRPFKTKRRRKKTEENEPFRPIINLKEIENAELLAWAWAKCRLDILAQFGIHLPVDFFEP